MASKSKSSISSSADSRFSQLRALRSHAPNHVTNGRGALRASEPQGLQVLDETDFTHH